MEEFKGSFYIKLPNGSENGLSLQKYENDDADYTLIGTDVSIEYVPDPTQPDKKVYDGFFGVNPFGMGNSSSEMHLELEHLDIDDDLKNEIRNAFFGVNDKAGQGVKATLISEIQKISPDFFDKIDEICQLNDKRNISVSSRVIDSIITPNSKILALIGLPGYAKSSTIKAVYNDLTTKNVDELKKIYGISEDVAKLAKEKVPRNFSSIAINDTMELTDLFAFKSIATNPITGNSESVTDNAGLLVGIKLALYKGISTMLMLDEACDNPLLLKQAKGCFMPDINGNYVFASAEMRIKRNFVALEDKDIRILNNGNEIKTNYILMEVGGSGDGQFTMNDNAIIINDNGITIDTSHLCPQEKRNLNLSLMTQGEAKKLEEKPERKSEIYQAITNRKLNSFSNGGAVVFISPEKYAEIAKNNNLKSEIISTGASYAVNREMLNIAMTGNQTELDPATLDRMMVALVDGISYKDLERDLVNGLGVKSPLFEKLKEVAPDKSAIKELVRDIIDFTKVLVREQHNGEIAQPEPFNGKELPFSNDKLSSLAMSPRRICEILNISSTTDELVQNFKKYSNQILGINGLADVTEKNDIIRFEDMVDSILANNLDDLAIKYGLKEKSNIGVKDEIKNALMSIPSSNLNQGSPIALQEPNTSIKI